MTAPAFDAIIVAGGRSSRLQGGDKTLLVYNGRTLLERAVDAATGARRIVTVGPTEVAGTIITLESPRFGGPAAAIAAGLDALETPAEWVLTLASDLPFAKRAVAALVDALPGETDGVIAIDDSGRRQPLLAVYRSSALAAAVAGTEVAGLSMRALLAGLDLTEIPVSSDLTADIDSRADAAALGIRVTGPAC